MNLLQDVPAQTTSYLIAGYAVIFGMMLIYIFSLFLRSRNLKADLDVLNEMESD